MKKLFFYIRILAFVFLILFIVFGFTSKGELATICMYISLGCSASAVLYMFWQLYEKYYLQKDKYNQA